MTNSKPTTKYGLVMWMLMAGMVASLTGCQMLATIGYLTMPNDMPAEYEGLNGQRVVVIVQDVGGLGYQDATVPTDLARYVSADLKNNVKKIDIVSQDRVNNWIDSNDTREMELGKAMEADKVVAIQLEHFRLNRGPNLYQGQAEVSLQVLDVKTGDIKDMERLDTLYPPHSSVPLDQSEGAFRRKFIGVLSKQIGRRFYAYESIEASKDRLYPSE